MDGNMVASIILNNMEKEMQPTPVFWPGKSHGQRSRVQATVHGVTESRTRLSYLTFTFTFLNSNYFHLKGCFFKML